MVESTSREAAVLELKSRGLFPTAVEEARGLAPVSTRRTRISSRGGGPVLRLGRRSVSRKAVALFTRQLATLIKAGLPLVRALEVLTRQERNPRFRTIISSVAETIRSGGALSEGLAQHPRVFDRLYVNMTKAGEAGGVLHEVMERLAQFLEKAERVKAKVRSAMTYPVIIMLVAAGIVGALMAFVVPKFEGIFQSLLKGEALPPLTLAVLTVSRFVQGNVIVTFALSAGAVAALTLLKRTRWGTRVWDWLAIRLPVLGPLGLKAAIARFTRTFGTLLASGVPILEALRITRDTSSNTFVADALDRVHERVKGGDGLAGPLEATQIFPPMVTTLVEVGEETGALPAMLGRIADTYDEEVDQAASALTSILEPMMIVVMAVVVGTIVIALFLPIVRIIQVLG
jgi:type IV pilus assembly protein PilC